MNFSSLFLCAMPALKINDESDNGIVEKKEDDNMTEDERIGAQGLLSLVLSLPEEVKLPNFTLGREEKFLDFLFPEWVELSSQRVECEEWICERIIRGVRITPLKAGEFKIPIRYTAQGRECILNLTVNPDPWTLWKVNEPQECDFVFDEDRKRRDVDHHQNMIAYESEKLMVLGASRRGRSHEHAGSFRDDDMGFWKDESTGRYFFIVSDGAGSCKYSREGSRLVIKHILEKVDANITEEDWKVEGKDLSPSGKIGMKLAGLVNYAREKIKEYVDDENGKHPEKLWSLKDFSATILIAAVKMDPDGGLRIVTFSIGDGAIAWKVGDCAHVMNSPDSGEFGGGTRFFTTPEVWAKIFSKRDNLLWTWENFCDSRVQCKCFTPQEAEQVSLFLMSDGVSDPWFETDADLLSSKRWVDFVDGVLMEEGVNKASLLLEEGAEKNARRLLDWLDFKIPGNHDDRTIIAVFASGVHENHSDNWKDVKNAQGR